MTVQGTSFSTSRDLTTISVMTRFSSRYATSKLGRRSSVRTSRGTSRVTGTWCSIQSTLTPHPGGSADVVTGAAAGPGTASATGDGTGCGGDTGSWAAPGLT